MSGTSAGTGIADRPIADLAVGFETMGLSMELLSASDIDLYVRLYTSEAVMRHVAPALSATAAEEAFRLVLERMSRRPPASLYWSVTCGHRELRSGILALIFDPDWKGAEIGILLEPGSQGRGNAPAAIAGLAERLFRWDPGFLLRTHYQPSHPAVPKVLRKLGFVSDGLAHGRPEWRLDAAAWRTGGGRSFATVAD